MSDKIEVRRGNVYLTIEADAVDRYVAKGFDVLDADGNVVKKSVPNDLRLLQKEYQDQLEEIEKLTAEVKALKAENEALKSKAKGPAPKKESDPKPEIKSDSKTTKKSSAKK